MAVYQVAIIFESPDDQAATAFAESVAIEAKETEEDKIISNAKISFTKFEKEAEEVAHKPVV